MLATVFIIISVLLIAVIWIGWIVWQDEIKKLNLKIAYWENQSKTYSAMWTEENKENMRLKEKLVVFSDQNSCLAGQNDDLITQLRAKPPAKIVSLVDREAIKADADFVLKQLNAVRKAADIVNSKLEAVKGKLTKPKPAAKKKAAPKKK